MQLQGDFVENKVYAKCTPRDGSLYKTEHGIFFFSIGWLTEAIVTRKYIAVD